jgi:hypothetical protein
VNDPVRELVRKALRAMGAAHQPSAEEARLRDSIDRIFRPWRSESVQKLVAGWTARQDDLALLAACEYARIKDHLAAKDRRAKSDSKRRENREEFELWICKLHLENPDETSDEFRDRVLKRRKYPKYLRPKRLKGKVIGAEALRRIIVKHKNAS